MNRQRSRPLEQNGLPAWTVAQPVQEALSVTRRQPRGFTLIELMIVVVIVGVLSSLAVVGYRKLVTSSHLSEATNMVQAIRLAQESYHSETQTYDWVSNWGSLYPNTNPIGNIATAWGGSCGNCKDPQGWSGLPVHVDGPVIFGYETVAGTANLAPTPAFVTVNGAQIQFPTSPPLEWYIVGAQCDLDSAGGAVTSVYTSSWSNQVYVDSPE